jgi:hypothetical protein
MKQPCSVVWVKYLMCLWVGGLKRVDSETERDRDRERECRDRERERETVLEKM